MKNHRQSWKEIIEDRVYYFLFSPAPPEASFKCRLYEKIFNHLSAYCGIRLSK
jgi:hypothetical protein